MNSDIGGQGYKKFSNFLKNTTINNFKINKNFNYMTEHIGKSQIRYGKLWYKKILEINLLNKEQLIYLIKLNDKFGNSKLELINNNLIKCSPNTLKYIYFGLLNIIYIKNNNLTNFNFIEIGGGYGGQCIILQKLFNIFNIKIKKYILIDLPTVVEFQKKYITTNNLHHNVEFLNNIEYQNYNFNNISYLFSSYSLSEIIPKYRKEYYKYILKNTHSGFIVWNNKKIDLPKQSNINIIREDPLTGSNNKFIYYTN